MFDLHEENLRFLMSVVIVIAAVLGGVLSVLAAREEQSSLRYSVAVFAGATALSELSYVMAGDLPCRVRGAGDEKSKVENDSHLELAPNKVIKSFAALTRTCKPPRALHAAYHNR